MYYYSGGIVHLIEGPQVRKGYSITIAALALIGSLSLVVYFYPVLYSFLGKLTFAVFLAVVLVGFFLFEFIIDKATKANK